MHRDKLEHMTISIGYLINCKNRRGQWTWVRSNRRRNCLLLELSILNHRQIYINIYVNECMYICICMCCFMYCDTQVSHLALNSGIIAGNWV